MPRALRLAAIFVHPGAAILAIAAIILYIYTGIAAVPGAFRGMLRGSARTHHPGWYREIAKH